jgi:transketolase N-terminal domain/subunit
MRFVPSAINSALQSHALGRAIRLRGGCAGHGVIFAQGLASEAKVKGRAYTGRFVKV